MNYHKTTDSQNSNKRFRSKGKAFRFVEYDKTDSVEKYVLSNTDTQSF